MAFFFSVAEQRSAVIENEELWHSFFLGIYFVSPFKGVPWNIFHSSSEYISYLNWNIFQSSLEYISFFLGKYSILPWIIFHSSLKYILYSLRIYFILLWKIFCIYLGIYFILPWNICQSSLKYISYLPWNKFHSFLEYILYSLRIYFILPWKIFRIYLGLYSFFLVIYLVSTMEYISLFLPTPRNALSVYPFVGPSDLLRLTQTHTNCGKHGLSVLRARRTMSWRPEWPPARSRGPDGPQTSSVIYFISTLLEYISYSRLLFDIYGCTLQSTSAK